MRNKIKIIITILIMLLTNGCSKKDLSIEELESRIKNLEAENAKLHQQLDSSYYEGSEPDINIVHEQYDIPVEIRYDNYDDEIYERESEIEELQSENNALHDRLDETKFEKEDLQMRMDNIEYAVRSRSSRRYSDILNDIENEL